MALKRIMRKAKNASKKGSLASQKALIGGGKFGTAAGVPHAHRALAAGRAVKAARRGDAAKSGRFANTAYRG